MSKPWYKQYRNLKDHPIRQDPIANLIFDYIKDSVDEYGVMTTGRYQVATFLKINPNTYYKALHERLCKRWGLVKLTTSKDGKYTIIAVVGWKEEQSPYAEREIVVAQDYPQHGNTSNEYLSTISVTQANEAKEDISVTQEEGLVTLTVTQAVTQSGNTSNSLENEDLVTQSVTNSGNTSRQHTSQSYTDNTESNIYIGNVENEKPKPQKAFKKDVGINDKYIRQFLDSFNKAKGTNYTAVAPLRNNFALWLTVHELEVILKAADNVGIHPYWKPIITPEILLRRKNTRGEDVDRISELAYYSPSLETESISPSKTPLRNATQERLERERAAQAVAPQAQQGGGMYGAF